MPYLRSAMPTAISQPSSPRKERVVFHKDPVEGISRPVNVEESWAAYHFETHARKCAYCHDAYHVHRSREQLCELGHRLAQEVARFIYNKADGNTYSTVDEDSHPVRVEIPAGYTEVSSLLKAIERSLRHRSRHSFVSLDRSYYVAPRAPASPPKRSHSVKVSHEPKSSKSKSSRPRFGEIVDWPDREPQSPKSKRVLSEITNNAKSKRGSLYEEDMANRRNKTYAVEVREPTLRDIRDHRASGYYR